MDRLKYLLLGLMLTLSAQAMADRAPQVVKDSLQSLYPTVKTVGWITDGPYYVAGFEYDGFVMRVWFDSKGRWQMKQTDWQVMDEAPEAVYHTFTFGPYSTDEVMDVTLVEFPRQKAQVVVLIGIDNAPTEYQLFYLTDGELINARNVSDMNDILGADTFL